MSCLQILRHSKTITRWVLVWFSLSLGIATAAPALQTQNLTRVCSASGQSKFVNIGALGTGGPEQPGTVAPDLHRHLDCLLCLGLNSPPVHHNTVVLTVHPPGAAPSGRLPSFAAHTRISPLSARGPPMPTRPA